MGDYVRRKASGAPQLKTRMENWYGGLQSSRMHILIGCDFVRRRRGLVWQKSSEAGPNTGGGVFRRKNSSKSMTLQTLAVGYLAYFARFCTAYCCQFFPISHGMRASEMLLI